MARWLIATLLVAGACRPDGGNRKTMSREDEGRFLDHVRGLRDRGCACRDLGCFDPIVDELLEPRFKAEGTVSPETDEAASKMLDELRGCQRRILEGSGAAGGERP